MKLSSIFILLPVDVLEDLPLDPSRADAESLLSTWTVPFHPAIVSSSGKIPQWESLEHFLDRTDIVDALLLLPASAEHALSEGWLDKARAAGAVVLQDPADREAALAQVLGQLEPGPGELSFDRLNAELVADFAAIGYCHFMVELITHRQHYMGNLDEEAFSDATVRAAEAIVQGKEDEAREAIQLAFDTLTEARENYYLVESTLIDLTLVAPGTAGQALRDELAADFPVNMLATARTLQTLADREPATLEALRAAMKDERADAIGGEFGELPLPLLGPESILADLRRGLAVHEKLLGKRPTVFARRRFGLTPLLPQILRGCGFAAAAHFTLDGGRFPATTQSKLLWEGDGEAEMESIGQVPFDAASPGPFLRLPESLGDAMDLDNTPTTCFAHWPGRAAVWYDALRRMNRYAPALGKFCLLNDYFEETVDLGQNESFTPDQYVSPYLVDAVEKQQPDPISRWVRHHARQAKIDAIESLRFLASAVEAKASLFQGVEKLRSAVDDRAEQIVPDTSSEEAQLESRLDTELSNAVLRLGGLLTDAAASDKPGRLLLNPRSFDRSKCWSEPAAPPAVETPSMGFAWVGERHVDRAPDPGPKRGFLRRKAKPRPPMADESVLRNDLFEVTLDPTTGAIRAIHDYRTRGNRLAVQLAMRLPSSHGPELRKGESAYTIMAADRMEASNDSPREGRLVVRGRLVDRHGNRVARFTQTLSARRADPVLGLDIELEPEQEPDASPWQSYYAARFAWDDAAADLLRSVNLTCWPTDAAQFESPHFLEIREARRTTTILTGGLPFHRRVGPRKLDSLLIVRGERERRFRLGIAIDQPHAASAGLDFLTPCCEIADSRARPKSDSGWLFHIDAPNVVATGWTPLVEDGQMVGYCVRLLETEGRNTKARLRSFRSPTAARQTDFLGEPQEELVLEDERVIVNLSARQWTQVEVRWQPT